MRQGLKKSLKLAGALAIVLGAASPVLATSASAAPYGHSHYMQRDSMRDHRHMPKMRYERRSQMPHHGHYKWREGRWNWRHGHWAWAPGIWIRF